LAGNFDRLSVARNLGAALAKMGSCLWWDSSCIKAMQTFENTITKEFETASLPNANETLILITPHFRCLGYLDNECVWRGYSHNDRIKDVIDWEKW
jgi:hypothetical protein